MLLLVRAHYVLYVRREGKRWTAVITWVATVLVIGFWTWQFLQGPSL